MNVTAGAATDIGKVRENNEDFYLIDEPLFAVADGMGGALGGEVASQLAIQTVEELFRAGKGSLAEHVRLANRAVFERSVRDRAVAGMGTTLTAVKVEGSEAHLVHVGDSRAYLLRAGDLRLLTEDHTLVQRMVKRGEITKAEAEVHPHRNVMTRALGTEPDIEVDETSVALLDGDRLLLCSDGLTAMVTEQQVQAILESEPDPKRAAERLVRAANRAGGIDNITTVVLDARKEEPTSGDTAGLIGRRISPPSKAATLRWAVRAGITLTVVGALFAGFRVYVDHQWYVGSSNGRVAVFQGIPATLGHFRFSHVVEQEDLQASTVEQLPLYSDLEKGITANSRAEAVAIVAQMRRDLGTAGQAGVAS